MDGVPGLEGGEGCSEAVINLRSEQVLPLAKVALEAHALRDLEAWDSTPLVL
jgi:hypothetical protein